LQQLQPDDFVYQSGTPATGKQQQQNRHGRHYTSSQRTGARGNPTEKDNPANP